MPRWLVSGFSCCFSFFCPLLLLNPWVGSLPSSSVTVSCWENLLAPPRKSDAALERLHLVHRASSTVDECLSVWRLVSLKLPFFPLIVSYRHSVSIFFLYIVFSTPHHY
ncbi:uncharacterized protein BP01DRAFT_354363 [Aspergillus saccharolyticus JOP 1030-1]|uniref:Secreted protein n=1 Tax=Aspergillus saccharolyticus JOP 1030-1 TaxID=1450539 RepID=A0A318ZMB7_9EURO|nr:hypothetical protein BP01DRAFT_354363 [Aspergillus saccharolyticus JOP 1030-1]PYH47825.1 hypothetical protein BP01DRAFT_354363 [Aspergillus saccharolyticus JOP 1030-1]